MWRRKFILSIVATSNILSINSKAEQNSDKKNIALIGATARSGREIIRQALVRGHKIKGLARTPSKLNISHPNLKLFKGDVRNQKDLENILTGSEIVISMVGKSAPESPLGEIGKVDLYTVMAKNLIGAMKNKGNKILIMASSTGVETMVSPESPKPTNSNLTDMWRWNARYLYNDMFKMERMIIESGLEYILLRPGFIVEGPARENLEINTTNNTPPLRVLTYSDFADFILNNLDNSKYLNSAIGIYTETIMDPQAEIDDYYGKN